MNNVRQNVRQNKPSASGAERWVNCPASFLPSLQLEQTSSAEADEGTMLHKACELILNGETVDFDLSSEQEKLVNFAVETARSLNDEDLNCNVLLEQRLWSKTKAYSGQADVIYLYKDRAVVIDYKFGRGDVASATGNWQLATLAVLIADNFSGINTVDCYIIQPRSLGAKVSSTRYTSEHLKYAKNGIEKAIGRIEFDIERKCGEWCGYCPLVSSCPKAKAEIETFKAFEITAENAFETFRKIKQKRMILDAMERKVKELAQAQEINGLVWVEGAKRAKFIDTQKTFECFSQIIPAEKFLTCVKIDKGELEKLYLETMQNMHRDMTKAQLQTEFNSLIRPLIEYKQNSPTLKIQEL